MGAINGTKKLHSARHNHRKHSLGHPFVLAQTGLFGARKLPNRLPPWGNLEKCHVCIKDEFAQFEEWRSDGIQNVRCGWRNTDYTNKHGFSLCDLSDWATKKFAVSLLCIKSRTAGFGKVTVHLSCTNLNPYQLEA